MKIHILLTILLLLITNTDPHFPVLMIAPLLPPPQYYIPALMRPVTWNCDEAAWVSLSHRTK